MKIFFRLFILLMVLAAIPAQAELPNSGYTHVATKSFDIANPTPYNIGANLPKGTIGFELTVYNGSLVVNCQADLATGSMPNGTIIASGSSMIWRNLDPDDTANNSTNFWGLPTTASVSCRLVAWRRK